MESEYKIKGHSLVDDEPILGRAQRVHAENVKSFGKLEVPKLGKLSELED